MKVGDVLALRYRVERVLGMGGMGVVVAARHVQLGSPVALKVMLPQEAHSPGGFERFLNEARAVSRLRGEHVVRIGDFGTLDTGAPYIVMELLEGADLQAVVEARGPLPIQEAVEYVLDACEAMDEAHRAGIVHRDLKPKNLFLTHRLDGSPIVKVLDFGISKLTDEVGAPGAVSTSTGAILGSPAFMSPEQMRSAKHVDARTDIYALGGIIFYLLTGDYPFQAGTMVELFVEVLQSAPRGLRACRPDAPEALDAIVARCLEKDCNLRFPNVRELMAALEPFAGASGPSRIAALSSADLHIALADSALPLAASPSRSLEPAAVSTHGTLAAASSPPRSRRASKSRILPLLLMGIAVGGSLMMIVTTILTRHATRPNDSAASAIPSAAPAVESAPPREVTSSQSAHVLPSDNAGTTPSAVNSTALPRGKFDSSSTKRSNRAKSNLPAAAPSESARPKNETTDVFGTPD